jgi:DNA polymerase III alpha subunit
MSGKERSPLAMDEIERSFLEKAAARDVDPDVAREIWRQISSFAAYAFCKAHSASFAQLSLQVAYLRAYYPAEFMAAVLSNQGGYYSTMAYVEEARRMGLRILLPDVLRGEYAFRAEGPHSIRVGLMQARDIAAKNRDAFFAERARRPFESFADFLLRTTFGESEIETLVKCGACDSFGYSRMQLLWLLKALFPAAVARRGRSGLIGPEILRVPEVPRLRDYTLEQKLYWEMQLLDVAVSAHPLHLFKPWKKARGCVPAQHLRDYTGEYVQAIGWLVTTKPASTRKGERMLFASFEDTGCLYETTLFPRAYQRFAALLVNRGPYVVCGTVDEDHGVFTITVEHLRNLNAQGSRGAEARRDGGAVEQESGGAGGRRRSG